MKRTLIEQEEIFVKWITENQGTKAGPWYSRFLKRLGQHLAEFKLKDGLRDNFFEYQKYNDFKKTYLDITHEEEKEIERILNGERVRYPSNFLKMQSEWEIKYRNFAYENELIKRKTGFQSVASLGTLLRAYLRFLYYDENKDLIYPKKVSI